jgi:hypothetical protein
MTNMVKKFVKIIVIPYRWLPSVRTGLSIPTLDSTDAAAAEGCSTEGASWLRHDRWKDWIASPFYRKVILYKLRGEQFFLDPAEDIGRNEARAIRRKSHRYVMAEASAARLFYREKTGRLSMCVLETEVPKVCHSLHDVHGHFATGITVGRAYGEYYWPTRDRDIAHWVQTCIHCQRCHTKLRTAELRPILQFKPMDMLAIDYIGPITPPVKDPEQNTSSLWSTTTLGSFSPSLCSARIKQRRWPRS